MGVPNLGASLHPDLGPLCMYDPYTSTHTIIRVTVKFRHQLAPRFGTPMYVGPIYQHSHHHKSNCQIPSPACTQIWDPCMYDPYTSTHTIITVTVKKCHHSPPDLPPLCDPYTSIHSIITVTVKKCLPSPPDLPPLCVTHIPALIKSLQQLSKSVTTHPQICHLYVLDPYS